MTKRHKKAERQRRARIAQAKGLRRLWWRRHKALEAEGLAAMARDR